MNELNLFKSFVEQNCIPEDRAAEWLEALLACATKKAVAKPKNANWRR